MVTFADKSDVDACSSYQEIYILYIVSFTEMNIIMCDDIN